MQNCYSTLTKVIKSLSARVKWVTSKTNSPVNVRSQMARLHVLNVLLVWNVQLMRCACLKPSKCWSTGVPLHSKSSSLQSLPPFLMWMFILLCLCRNTVHPSVGRELLMLHVDTHPHTPCYLGYLIPIDCQAKEVWGYSHIVKRLGRAA